MCQSHSFHFVTIKSGCSLDGHSPFSFSFSHFSLLIENENIFSQVNVKRNRTNGMRVLPHYYVYPSSQSSHFAFGCEKRQSFSNLIDLRVWLMATPKIVECYTIHLVYWFSWWYVFPYLREIIWRERERDRGEGGSVR